MPDKNYEQDLAFMGKHTKVVELAGEGDAWVAVAPAYQGRIMTSTLAGPRGASFGWLNCGFIAAGREDDPHFNNYGGEDRFWLGPEGGQFALWFAKGDPFDLEHWRTPRAFSTGPFEVTSQGPGSVALAAEFTVANFSGTKFHCAVKRIISILDRAKAASELGAEVPAELAMAAFQSHNTLANVGQDWNRRMGLVSVWTLGQFKPLPRGKVIVPFNTGEEKTLGPCATTDYFGPLPPDRCRVGDGRVLFSCDGRSRGKIGVSPARAKGVLGSYDPDNGVLTVVQFNLPPSAAQLPYVNSLWQHQDKPFAGDAINSYNDGAGDEGPGGFYELETSSPAAELKNDRSITHIHKTFHFKGPKGPLGVLAQKVLGVDIARLD